MTTPLPVRALLRCAWLVVLIWLTGCGGAVNEAEGVIQITAARLVSSRVQGDVVLPHQLGFDEFSPQGETVEFTMSLHLPALPGETRPLGIYVSKMALAGSVSVNGHLDAACGRGRVEVLRCAQQPHLFVPPPSLWKVGTNELTFRVYADRRQSNGLSAVLVGDAEALGSRWFRWRYLLTVDLVIGLAWLSVLLGTLAVLVAVTLREESFYLWFGLASLAGGVSNVVFNVTHPPFSPDLFGRVVFATRFVSLSLMIPMLFSVFNQLRPWFRNGMLLYLALGLAAIAMFGNDRATVIALYAPLLVFWVIMPVLLSYWTWKHPTPLRVQISIMAGFLLAASVADWLRLNGQSAFEGVYLIPYAYSGQMVVMGSAIIGLLAHALAQARELSADLEARVVQRTAELKQAHAQIVMQEVERNKALERERMLQDMHDGFGTQLASARRMAEQGSMTQTDMRRVLQECMSDLYLVVDTLSDSGGTIRHAVADFRHRIQQRLMDTGLAVHWNVRLCDAPEISARVVLQVLRIAQEALNNTLKHSRADNIWIDMVYREDLKALEVVVRDDGIGLSDEMRLGRGIHNMRARARDIGAELGLDSPAGGGTTLRLTWPVNSSNLIAGKME